MPQLTPFAIPLWAELVAVAIGALQGALFALGLRDRRIDVLGAVLVGIGVALGGSLLRDVLLGEPPVVIRGAWYVLTAAVTALVALVLSRVFARLDAVIVALDALTIGVFGAIGTTKALALGVPPVPAVFVGAAAATGGSVVRDVTLGLPAALLQVGSLYAVAAGAGGILIVVLVAFGVAVLPAAVAAVVLTTAIRLLAVRFGWTFPEQSVLVVNPRGR